MFQILLSSDDLTEASPLLTLFHQARIEGTKIEIDGKWSTAKEEGELNSEKEGKEKSSDGSGEESVENEEIEEQKEIPTKGREVHTSKNETRER
ncbi:hypothetical protein JTB14_022338 [Gonioctena quinquepunctata]|nr:hypothetical protein JTB14_022338 [Gonioctena quinquepunctata]